MVISQLKTNIAPINRREMPSKNDSLLFDDDENAEPLKINKAFAQKFEARKNKEEMSRLMSNPKLRAMQRRKDARLDESSSSSSDEEDSDAELVTPEVGAKVLSTISRIRMGRKEIYDPEQKFFNDEDFEIESSKVKKGGPLTFTKFMSSVLKKVFIIII